MRRTTPKEMADRLEKFIEPMKNSNEAVSVEMSLDQVKEIYHVLRHAEFDKEQFNPDNEQKYLYVYPTFGQGVEILTSQDYERTCIGIINLYGMPW